MAKRPSAGDLKHRVAFDARATVDDGYGNPVSGDFAEQFQRRAKFSYAGGGEAVMAARLEGREVFKVNVRSDSLTMTIKSGWQMRDARLGTVYAIDAVDNITDPAWIYLDVETGVAS